MSDDGKIWLIGAGIGASLAALLHLAMMGGGAPWYRVFGAGEWLAKAAERGSWYPHILAFLIAAILALWAAYAFSGARLLPAMPFLRFGLLAISAVCIVRGMGVFVPHMWRPDLTPEFKLWSSIAVLILGLLFAVGTRRAWPDLGTGARS